MYWIERAKQLFSPRLEHSRHLPCPFHFAEHLMSVVFHFKADTHVSFGYRYVCFKLIPKICIHKWAEYYFVRYVCIDCGFLCINIHTIYWLPYTMSVIFVVSIFSACDIYFFD